MSDEIQITVFMKMPPVQFEGPAGKATLSLERFLRLLLLHESATRMELGKQSGFSAASITLRSQWLLEHGFLEKLSERRLHSKRPVETLSLKRQPWSTAALRVGAERLHVDLLDSQGHSLWSAERRITKGAREVQSEIFRGFRELTAAAQEQGAALELPLTGTTFSVDGIISGSVGPGTIFRLNGMDNWIPCQPRFIEPILEQVSLINQWAACVCKVYGLARELKTDHRVGYFQIGKHDLHLATVSEGSVSLGNLGTSGVFLHQSVQLTGPDCYCGRQGCLDALLRAGKATAEQIFGAIQRLLEMLQITHVGIEWQDGPTNLEEAFACNPRCTLVPISDPVLLEQRGLALLSTEAALLRDVETLQQPTPSAKPYR